MSFLQNFPELPICQYVFKCQRMEISKAVVLRHYSPDLMIPLNFLMKSGHFGKELPDSPNQYPEKSRLMFSLRNVP